MRGSTNLREGSREEAAGLDCWSSGVIFPYPGKHSVIATKKKDAVPGYLNPLRAAEQADNRQKMLGKAAGLKSEADP